MESFSFSLEPQQKEEPTGFTFSYADGLPEKTSEIEGEKIAIALNQPNSAKTIAEQLRYDLDKRTYREAYLGEEQVSLEKAQLQILDEIVNSASLSGGQYDLSLIASQYKDVASVNPFATATDPEINLELGFGEKFSDFIVSAMDVPSYQEFINTDVGMQQHQLMVEQSAWNSYLQDKIAYIRELDTGNPFNDAYDIGTSLLPFFGWAKISNEVEGAPSSAWLPGANRQQQVNYILSLPLKDRVNAVNRYLQDRIDEGFLDNASEFLGYLQLQGISNYDAAYTSISEVGFNALEFASGGFLYPVTKGSKIIGKSAVSAFRHSPSKSLQYTSEAVGDVSSATATKMYSKFTGDLKGSEEIHNKAWAAMNPSRFFSGVSSLTNDAYRKLSEQAEKGTQLAADAFNSVRIARHDPLQYQSIVKQQLAEMSATYARSSKDILDIGERADRIIPETNTTVLSLRIGRAGDFFASEKAAQKYADSYIKLKTEDYELKQVAGDKWFIEVTSDMDESSGFKQGVNNLKIETREAFNDSLANKFIATLRTPRDVLSASNVEARMAALHGGQRLNQIFSDLVKPIGKLKKEESENLITMLEVQRDGINSTTGKRGFYFKNAEEFRVAYLNRFGSLPTEAQYAAQLAYRQAMDTEFLIRIFGLYRDVISVGGKEVVASFLNKEGKATLKGLGRRVQDVDFSKGNFRIAVIDEKGKVSFKESRFTSREEIERLKSEGFDIAETVETPFNFGEGKVAHYIISKSELQVNRVKINELLGYSEGGHVINKYPFYLKQAKLVGDKLKYFMGDNVLMNAYTLKQAENLADIWERVRISLRDGTDDWKKIVDEEMPWTKQDKVLSEFVGKKARLSLDSPIVASKAGNRSIDSKSIQGIETGANDFNKLSLLDRRFTQEKGANTQILREEENGIFELDRAPLLNPVEALEAATKSAIEAQTQKDYVLKSINQLSKQFGDILKPELVEKGFSDPFAFLYGKENYISGAVGSDQWKLAEAARKAILRQVGDADRTSQYLDTFRVALAEYAAPGGAKFQSIEKHLLPLVKDPVSFFKNIAFDLKLGFFNPVQVFVQAQTLVHTYGLLGAKNAWKAATSSMVMQRMLWTEEDSVIKWAGKSVAKMHDANSAFGKMTADEFEESYKALKKSGWHLVGKDLAWLDDTMNNDLFVRGRARRVLDSGRVFFNGIERTLRLNGWNGAYLEWKSLNKGAKLDDAGIQWIIARADDLTVNMSSANNAVWQRGAFGAMTQFASYQIRLMEQLLPSLLGQGRLPAKKAWQLFGVYSFMYGIPFGGVSAAFGGIAPFGEIIREELERQGVNVQDSYLETLVDGAPSVLVEALTGYDLDFAGRLAPGGYSLGYDIWQGDVSVLEALGGAPYSIGSEVIGDIGTVIGATVDAAHVSSNKGQWKVVGDSVVDLLKNASSLKQGYDVYAAWQYGRWLTANGRDVASVDNLEGTIARIFGLTPTSISYDYVRKNILRKEEQAKRFYLGEARKNYERAIKSSDPATSDEYFRKAKEALIAGGVQDDLEAQKVYLSVARNFGKTEHDRVQDRWNKRQMELGQ